MPPLPSPQPPLLPPFSSISHSPSPASTKQLRLYHTTLASSKCFSYQAAFILLKAPQPFQPIYLSQSSSSTSILSCAGTGVPSHFLHSCLLSALPLSSCRIHCSLFSGCPHQYAPTVPPVSFCLVSLSVPFFQPLPSGTSKAPSKLQT